MRAAMNRSILPVRLSTLAMALLLAQPAFAEDQPKSPPPAEAAKAAPPPPATAQRPAMPKSEADSLLGKEVYGADGSQMGLVTNVLIDRDGKPIALVIDFGGFLGVGSRKIAIDWNLMQFRPGNKDKPVTLSLTKDQLKAAPEYKSDKPALIMHAPATPEKPAPPPEKSPAK
jgi:sporulation protein YlmC with PRC-barrel domain